jgi:hypothetical protein
LIKLEALIESKTLLENEKVRLEGEIAAKDTQAKEAENTRQ